MLESQKIEFHKVNIPVYQKLMQLMSTTVFWSSERKLMNQSIGHDNANWSSGEFFSVRDAYKIEKH